MFKKLLLTLPGVLLPAMLLLPGVLPAGALPPAVLPPAVLPPAVLPAGMSPAGMPTPAPPIATVLPPAVPAPLPPADQGSHAAPPADHPGPRQVVLVVCDYLELEDLDPSALPNLYGFFTRGGIALLNTNTGGAHVRPNAAATVSAGRVALGTPQETVVCGGQETYRNENPLAVFQARTGTVPGRDNLVVPDLPLLIRQNAAGFNKAAPGTLGDSLHQAGLRTGALGNADLSDLPQRSMAVIAMDGSGVIDAGDVSAGLLLSGQGLPAGLQTNYAALERSFRDLRGGAQFMVIDLGDLVRLEQSRPYLQESVYGQERQRILARYDSFVGWLLRQVDPGRSRVLVAALTPSPRDLSLNRSLGLLGVRGEGVSPGLLLSPTTRRPGIITLYDLAPSISAYLGAPPNTSWLGRAWSLQPDPHGLENLQALAQRIYFTAMMRAPLVKGYAIIYLVVLGMIVLSLIWRPGRGRYLEPLLLALLAIPLVWLLIGCAGFSTPYQAGSALSALPGLPGTASPGSGLSGAALAPGVASPNIPLYVGLFLALVLLITAASLRLARNNLDAVLLLCMTTALLLLGDTVSGSPLQKYAVLGYDPMDGARFYGIGNEYMGVLMGAIIMGSALLLQRLQRHRRAALAVIGGLLLLTAAVLGAPQLGSKFGGFLTALAAFPYTFARFNGVQIRGRQLATGALALALAGAGAILADWLRPPELRSHFGLLASSMADRGAIALQEIAGRKLAMNLRLIRYTIWTRVYLGSLIALGVLFFRPVGIFGRVLKKYPAVGAGLEGSLVAAVAALVFNDAGIVAAATAIVFPAATLFFLVMKEREDTVRSTTSVPR